jgi:hypothetical protein
VSFDLISTATKHYTGPQVEWAMTNQDEAERRRIELIEVRAYQIYLARGGFDGLDEEDWLKAEREVDALPTDGDELPASDENEGRTA